MKMKLSPLIPAASGKIGGHSISNTRNGIVMKTIKQPRRQASHLQSVQRFVTADITNKWQFLTPGQQAAWNHTASNYPYINNLGEPATRNGFQTFCFLNQNRHILELPILEDPPIYEPIVKPLVFLDPIPHDKYIINGTNLKSHYIYVVYLQIHYSYGASTFEQTPLDIVHLTAQQLANGFDLIPSIRNTYATGLRAFRGTAQIVAIDTLTGNRDLNPPFLVHSIAGTEPSPTTELVSTIRGYSNVYAIGMSQDGLTQISTNYQARGEKRVLNTPWLFDDSDTITNFGINRANKWQFRYSADGMNLYYQSFASSICSIFHYILSNPYDGISSTPDHVFTLPGGDNPGNLYLSENGKLLITSTSSGSYKIEMATAFDLSTGSIIETDNTQKAALNKQGFYSTNGMLYFESINYNFKTYELNTPFQLTGRHTTNINTLNLKTLIPGTLNSQQSIWFNYDGTYLLLSVRSPALSYPSLYLFRLAIPWQMGTLI